MTVRLGTFDAESWWRPAGLASLPSAGRPGASATVAGMDELLAGFCEPGDLLVTRWPVDAAVRDGLGEAGVEFRHLAAGGEAEGTVESWVLRDSRVLAALRAEPEVAPYAVLPDTRELAGLAGWASLPDAAVVAEVNSKTWSNDLVGRLGLPGAARRVQSVDDLVAAVSSVDAPAVVKDPFGVSGRATVEIGTPGVLAAVARFLRGQDLEVDLLVQEKFAVRHDFSGHFSVGGDGRWEWRGVWSMTNKGFRHLGSGPTPPGLVDEERYRDVLVPVVEAVAAAGYSGPVCVDSALLEDGRVVPVLEINARHSLGLLTARLDERARRWGLRCHLVQVDVVVRDGSGASAVAGGRGAGASSVAGGGPGGVRSTVAGLVSALGPDRYQGGPLPGITVLSGSALTAPGGRVCAALFCDPAEVDAWRHRLHTAVAAAGMAVRGLARAA